MGATALQQNTIVKMDGVEHRLTRKVTSTLWQLEETKSLRIVEREHDQLLADYADGTLVLPSTGSVSHCGPANVDLSTKDFETAKVRRAYVIKALDVPNSQQAIEKVSTEVWEEIKAPKKPPCFTSIYLWKNRFLAANEDIHALVDQSSRKGPQKPYFPSEVLDICEQAITVRYLKREGGTIQGAYEEALLRTIDENKLRPEGLSPLRLPSRRLVARLIEKLPQFNKDAARHGRDWARKAYRSGKGHVVTDAPLQRAEIDHTLLDLVVVDNQTHLPLGRPYVTVCIDNYTRCILGLHVGFTPPSYQTVAMCLKNCFLPKVKLKSEYPEIKSEWPAYGVMRELVLDNGLEFHSTSLEQVCLSLNIEMTYSPRREAWFKGKIERFFGTMNRNVAHGQPGTTFSNIFAKGDYDPAKHAVITWATLKLIIRKWIADVYHQQVHSTLHTTPAKMWTSSIKAEDIRLPEDSTQLDAIMGTRHKRQLTHRGIEFEGLFYNSPELQDLRHQEGPKVDVEVRVDESNISSIYVVSPMTSRVYTVPALNVDYANGISLWQHEVFKKWQARNFDKKHNPEGWLRAKDEIRRMVERDLHIKSTKTRKRVARYQEESEIGAVKAGKGKALLTSSQGTYARRVVSILGEDAVSEPVQFDYAENNLGTEEDEDIQEFTAIFKEEVRNE